jgi:hypothetical protein
MVLSQWEKKYLDFGAARRKSNSGYRILPTNDRILLFLMRMRRDTTFEGLGVYFGVAVSTAHDYYLEMLSVAHSVLVPLLFCPLKAAQIRTMIPKDFARDLPGCLVIFDLTGFALNSKENVLLSRLLYSAYHHRSETGVLFGEP